MKLITIFERLLTHGYFPQELPPTFTTNAYGRFIANNWSSIREQFSSGSLKNAVCIPHSAARSGIFRRDLDVPNPIVFPFLCLEMADNWSDIDKLIRRSSWSTTMPIYNEANGRPFLPMVPFGRLAPVRAKVRTNARFIAKTDISRFYPSIYTHSVPWVIHGKTEAKKRKFEDQLLGNRLDKRLQNCSGGQTVGIPISPDTSFAIAELILLEVDARLQTKYPRLHAIRRLDDYEFSVNSHDEAEEVLGSFQEALAYLELSLNSEKTFVSALPIPLDPVWARSIQASPFRSKANQQRRDILRLFDRAFELVHEYPNESVLRYLLGRLGHEDFHNDNWDLYQSLLFQCMTVEPGTTISGVVAVIRYVGNGGTLNEDEVQATLNRLIVQHCKFLRKNEVVWLLWALLVLQLNISSETISAVERVIDPFVALLLLHGGQLGRCDKSIDCSYWEALMSPDELYGGNWLLSYEALVRGWLPSSTNKDYVEADPRFAALKEAAVRFYDEGAVSDPKATGAPPSLGVAPLFYTD